MSTPAPQLSADLLAILACPLDEARPPLRQEGSYLVCTVCGAAFPIHDGFPDLLPESAISAEEYAKVKL